MANSSSILEHILYAQTRSATPVTYQWLLPNVKGLENYYRTTDTSIKSSDTTSISSRHEASIFMAATESFSQRNTNCSIAESLSRFKPLLELAKTRDTPVRAYISVALGCPYEGPDVDPHKVADIALELLELGAYEISVADTTGMGTVPRTRKLLKTLSAAGIRNEDLAFHFHDTYGQALVNTVVALEHGIRTFDSAVGGLGGCPYSPGATGNVATEDLVHCLHSLGMETGIDLPAMAEIGAWISKVLKKSNESRAGKATLARIASEVDKSDV
jgi:hydroxymethylglutaryl-CoA lyase